MIGLNVVTLLGNIGDTPKITELKNEIKVARFSLATGEVRYDKDTGEKIEKTQWHRIVAWRELANIVEKFCKKGSRIHITGKLETSEYTDAEGIRRWATDVIVQNIILLDRPSSDNHLTPEHQETTNQPAVTPKATQNQQIKTATPAAHQNNTADHESAFANEDIPF